MNLQPGTRLAAYEVVGSLGAGGMGEVYRARDTRLQRDVAIKVLPQTFASDPERLARFEREAQLLAALNHPNIAQVFGVLDASDVGVQALVMELVDGEDLAARLGRGPLAVVDALPIAAQIAEALDAAHECGIVHRDLKPANVKLREDGTVKVLDFGLAKAMDATTVEASGRVPYDLVNSPTFTSPVAMTQMGLILGTAAYMAPEQAKGKAVDKRADIWAFGCVLYEMLSGRRPFAGSDVSETLASVLAREVDWSALPPTTPPRIVWLLRACLQKDPKHRLRDIGDAKMHLTDGPLEGSNVAAPPPRSRLVALLPWAVTGAVALGAAAVAVPAWRRAPVTSAGTVQFVVPTVSETTVTTPVLAPDGSFLVFAADRLYVRQLADLTTTPLPGTEHAENPFISLDSKWVGFFADGRIKKVAVAGGEPVDVVAAEADSPGAGWGPGDRIYFSRGWNGAALVAVPSDGGALTEVSTLDTTARERGHWWPQALPDGRHVLFTVWYAAAGLSESKVAVLDVQTGRHRVLFPGALARYAAGQVLYYRAGRYQVAPFDLEAMILAGDPQAVLPDAQGLAPGGSPQHPISVSADGTVAYLAGSIAPEVEMVWIGTNGDETPTGRRMHVHSTADLSPDGRRVAFGRPQGGTMQVVVADLASGDEQRLSAPGMTWSPIWHPDGQRLAFVSMRNGDFDVVSQRIDGSPEEVIESSDIDESVEAWLADGRMVVKNWQADGSTSVLLLDPAPGSRTTLITGSFSTEEMDVSPDGGWLAFVANPSGAFHVHVRALSGAGGYPQVSTGSLASEGGVRWAPRGNRIFYIRRWELVAATLVERDGTLVVEKEVVIARVPPRSALVGLSPDGERALIARPTSTASSIPPGVRVIVNGLPDGLRRPQP